VLSRKAPQREARPDRSAEFASFTVVPRAARIVRADAPRDAGKAQVAKPRAERWESVPWRRAVASLPCVLCGREGQTQAAHRNEGKGMGLKVDDCWLAALCVPCHADIDQGATMTREQRRELMDRAILLTIQALARAGRLRTVEAR
jgi:hypothetical protein